MESFTPVPALAGGCLIGLAAALLWLANGRIAGISGMVNRLVPFSPAQLWRLVFLAGLVAGTAIAALLFPGLGVGGDQPARLVAAPVSAGIPTPVWLAGHGICGLARLSPRSLVAVAVFFGAAIATVALTGVV
jgi:uncharacterized membrane protein YedE/YeeE